VGERDHEACWNVCEVREEAFAGEEPGLDEGAEVRALVLGVKGREAEDEATDSVGCAVADVIGNSVANLFGGRERGEGATWFDMAQGSDAC
jgi:hypothetical protein